MKYNVNPEILKILVDYTKERCNVYYKKEILKESSPWTNHPEIKVFKFTNVKRWLDKESKWAIDNIINNSSLTEYQKALNTALFIIVNKGETMIKQYNGPVKFENIQNKSWIEIRYFKCKEKSIIQNNAYFSFQINAAANKVPDIPNDWKYTPLSKLYFIHYYRDYILKAWKSDTAKDAFKYLLNIPGVGDFIAYQILTAMSYSSFVKYTDNDLAICGPGTIQGLKWLFKDINDNQLEDLIWYLRDNIYSICEENNLSWNINSWLHYLPEDKREFTLQDWTNSMCELNKLVRYKNNLPIKTRYYKYPNE